MPFVLCVEKFKPAGTHPVFRLTCPFPVPDDRDGASIQLFRYDEGFALYLSRTPGMFCILSSSVIGTKCFGKRLRLKVFRFGKIFTRYWNLMMYHHFLYQTFGFRGTTPGISPPFSNFFTPSTSVTSSPSFQFPGGGGTISPWLICLRSLMVLTRNCRSRRNSNCSVSGTTVSI